MIFEAKSLRASPPYFLTRRLFQTEPDRWIAFLGVGPTNWEQIPIESLPEFFYLDLIQFFDEAEMDGVESPLVNTKVTKDHLLKIQSFELFDGQQFYLEYLYEGEFPDAGHINIPVRNLIVTKEECDRFLASIGEEPKQTSGIAQISNSVRATLGAMAKLLGYKINYHENYVLDEAEIELISETLVGIAEEQGVRVSKEVIGATLRDAKEALKGGSQ